MTLRVLVTGANGFIGARATRQLLQAGYSVRAMVRRAEMLSTLPALVEPCCASLDQPDALALACEGIDAVLHCAGYAHAMGPGRGMSEAQQAAIHRATNHEGTIRLAKIAARTGVAHFVFLSSIKAMGAGGKEQLHEEHPLALQPPPPSDAYGQSKRKAEEDLLALSQTEALRVSCVRPAMVYGRGGRGNLERMARWIAKGVFPSLPETGNHRSLVHVEDLVDALCRVLQAGAASSPTSDCAPQAPRFRAYLVAHPVAPSGRQIEIALRRALGKREPHGAIPLVALRAAAWCGEQLQTLSGRTLPFNQEVLQRLLGSAWVSPDRILRELGWSPRFDLQRGLAEMLTVNAAKEDR